MWTTQFGGDGDDCASALSLGDDGRVHVVGEASVDLADASRRASDFLATLDPER